MLKERKIELQAKTIRRLQDDVIRLSAENKELKDKLNEQAKIVESAKKYADSNKKYLSSLADAKERYDTAVRDIVETKKRYIKEFEECVKGIK